MIINNNIKNTEDLINVVVDYANNENIDTISIFAKGIDNVLKLADKLADTNIDLLVTTFPTNEPIYIRNQDDEIEETFPEILSEKNRKLIENKGITIISSTLPLEPIVVPGNTNSTYEIISQTLNLFGNGIDLCIQAATMLTDNGTIKPTTRILTMNSQVALDLNACNSRFLFHPDLGIKINQIIK